MRRLMMVLVTALLFLLLIPAAQAACNHNWVLQRSVPGTCAQSGYDEYLCSKCGTFQARSTGTGGAHQWRDAYQAATCTKPGSSGSVCSVCGASDSRQIPPLGHNYGSWSSTNPTCKKDGVKKRSCSRCGAVESEPIRALGHAYSAWTVVAESTCAQRGTQERVCSRCHLKDIAELEEIPHTWGTWQPVTYATPIAEGTESHTCQVCSFIEERAVPMLKVQAHAQPQYGLTLILRQVTAPQDAYEVGKHLEFDWTLVNMSGLDLQFYGVSCTLPDGSIMDAVRMSGADTAASGESLDGSFSIQLDPSLADTDATLYFQAYLTAEPTEMVYTNKVTVSLHCIPAVPKQGMTFPAVSKPDSLELSIVDVEYPRYGEYYQLGEEIAFTLHITNTSTRTLSGVSLADPVPGIYTRCEPAAKGILTIGDLESGAFVDIPCWHIVNGMDVENGFAVLTLQAAWDDPVTRAPMRSHSAAMMVYTNETEPIWLDMIGMLASDSDDPDVLSAGDTVEYILSATNSTGEPLHDIQIYATVDGPLLETFDTLEPDEDCEFAYFHKLTKADTMLPCLMNDFVLTYVGDTGRGMSINLVNSVPLRPDDGIDRWLTHDEITSIHSLTLPVREQRSCMMINMMHDDAALLMQYVTCPEHAAAAELLNLADERGSADDWAALSAACLSDIDAMYSLFEDAADDDDSRLIVAYARDAFLEQLESYHTYLTLMLSDAPEDVERYTAMALYRHSMSLCMALSGSAVRSDSMLVTAVSASAEPLEDSCVISDTAQYHSVSLCTRHTELHSAARHLVNCSPTCDELGAAWTVLRYMSQNEMSSLLALQLPEMNSDGRLVISDMHTSFERWTARRREFLTLVYPHAEETVEELLAQACFERSAELCALTEAQPWRMD